MHSEEFCHFQITISSFAQTNGFLSFCFRRCPSAPLFISERSRCLRLKLTFSSQLDQFLASGITSLIFVHQLQFCNFHSPFLWGIFRTCQFLAWAPYSTSFLCLPIITTAIQLTHGALHLQQEVPTFAWV